MAVRKKRNEKQKQNVKNRSLKPVERLKESIKETKCMYNVLDALSAHDKPLGVILEKTVKILPAGWQYPEKTYARIFIEGAEYKTTNYKKTKYTMEEPVIIDGIKEGLAEIGYTGNPGRPAEGLFLEEKKSLLKNTAVQLSRAVKYRRAESELKKSGERFRTFTEQSLNAIAVAQGGYIVYANKSFEKLSGYSAQEIMEWKKNEFMKIVHPEHRAFIAERAEKNQKGENGGGNDYNAGLIDKKGKVKWVRVRSRTMEYDGAPSDFVTMDDITPLIKSREQAKQYLDIAGTVILVLDKNADIMLVNKKGRELLGCKSAENPAGKNWINDFIPENSRSEIKEYFKKLKSGKHGETDVYKNDVLVKGGGTKTLLWHNSVVRDENGMFEAVLSSGEDVTGRENVLEALKQSEQQFRTLVNNIPGAAYRCLNNENWTMLFISPHIRRIAGYPAEDFIDDEVRNYNSVIYPEDREAVRSIINRNAENDETFELEYRIIDSKGRIRWVNEKGRAVKEGGGVKWLDGVIADITEIKNYRNDLEYAIYAVKKADKLKSNFISVISHELRTPVTVIKGFLSFLEKGAAGPLNEKQSDFINTISDNTERLKRIIDDLVDVAKIESGVIGVETRDSDIVPVVTGCVRDLEHVAEKKGIQIRLLLNVDKRIMRIDKGRINQVLTNLINNAVKFSESGKAIEVLVDDADESKLPARAQKALDEGKAYLLIRVRDHGTGLAPEHKTKIFEKFFQVEFADTRKHQGSGLGLSIAKSIVESHEGMIWCESEGPGKGSVFCVLLPDN